MALRLMIAVGEGTPLVCELDPGRTVTLGRHRSNTVVLQDKHASRRHAEVYAQNDLWFLRDCGTMNGTRLDGEKIKEPRVLHDGSEIGIGDTRLIFNRDSQADDTADQPVWGEPTATDPPPDTDPGNEAATGTILRTDELSALCDFMAAAVKESTPRALVSRALAVVHSQTWASITGFLSLDPDDPLPRLVLPQEASVDTQLSRQLTRKAQGEGRRVWRGARESDDLQSDSLVSFTDALCVPLLVEGTALGALHVYKTGKLFSEREVRFCEVLSGYLANCLHTLRSRRTLAAENSRLRVHSPAGGDEMIGDSPALQQVRQHIARVAPRPCTVLVTGESGVGKELVALALHRQSPRCDGPLVTVNCGAITATLLESELFGHAKGAFTGANRDRPGFFQQADEGTLFLDEIGELSPECQVKLLRVIEGKSFRPVGASSEVTADVRIVAATHRNLEQMAREGKFRQDLYFRLGVPVRVPPLREHPEDVPALVTWFLGKLSLEYHRPMKVTWKALSRLQSYSWPGNVRQLRAVLENAVALADGDTLDADDLVLPDDAGTLLNQPPGLKLDDLEEWAIRQALRRTEGNVSAAAEVLGIHRDTLSSKIKKYEINKKEA